ncbi:MAG: hypothetical protein PVF68_04615 [Acidobacteriota bacterium]|jgi:SAM-dependent methyltransferase
MSDPTPEGVAAAASRAQRDALRDRYEARLRTSTELRWLASFAGNRDEPVHRWFPYKEGFSRGLVDRAVEQADLSPCSTVLDPFCGVGTTPLAARLRGHRGIGTDLLPLAAFVSRVKVAAVEGVDPERLLRASDALRAGDGGTRPAARFADIPLVRRAFDLPVLRAILDLRDRIGRLPDAGVRPLLRLALLASLEELSHTRKDGLCVRVRPRPRIEAPIEVVRRRAADMAADLAAVRAARPSRGGARILPADARRLPLRDGSVDLVVTSPPYLNRYDYARIYSLELALEFVASFDELRDLRHRLLRGHIEARPAATAHVRDGAVPEVLGSLRHRTLNNPNIPRMIHAYFEDMHLVVRELARVCRSGGRVALLVGNVRFGGEPIPVDLILADMAERQGFRVESIEVTRTKGNASQQMGRYGRLPSRESLSTWIRD